ncbi:RimK family alpha-L-glutamate ligase [Neolewinella aurantiaca]|uniref:RimK family alpha-L-glutamate ligase n=1 Tax=Neolewinella aurantiaca TaxID=2602767 RepID=A0A5C7FGH3_9BACT|nr:RimK family alpha-L-glutamate ligase [Neolewinella aurantiaca]TXF90367.1 RimK family alpha-L-glutamate ligase [Neolewinella aurantiaca]
MTINIFSRGPSLYSTQRLVEAGVERGHQTTVVDHGLCSPSLGEHGPSLLLNGTPIPKPDVSIPRIGANITNRGAAIIRQLEVLKVPTTISANGLLLARDKMSCLQVLAGNGVQVPGTVLCFTLHEVRRAGKTMGSYPIVVKLLESTHGVGVALAHTPYQLERIAEGFLRLQDRVILQEFIAESDGRDIRAFVVGNEVVAAMERKAGPDEFRANMHRGATARQVELSAEDEALAIRAAKIVGVEVAGVDLIPSNRGHLIMEVNASPGLEGIETHTGIDIAGVIVEYAVNKAFKLDLNL